MCRLGDDVYIMPRDYYQVLGISRSASQDEIKAAYRKLVRKFHPDANKSDASAGAKFKEVQEAYDVLSDTKKRENFDRFGRADIPEPPPGTRNYRSTGGTGGFRNSGDWQGGAGSDMGSVDLNDIFEKFSGFSRRSRGASTRQHTTEVPTPPNYDINHDVTLHFQQAARGTKLSLQLTGLGGRRPETLEVTIPPGVHEGSKVRLKGRGQPSPYGGRGDLNIITHIEKHPYFTRDGDDVILDLPISLTEAIHGATIEVPTLDGPVAVKVPPGINTNKKLRIKGRGLHHPSKPAGDQLCRIQVMLPENLNAAAQKDIDQWCDANPYNARRGAPWV